MDKRLLGIPVGLGLGVAVAAVVLINGSATMTSGPTSDIATSRPRDLPPPGVPTEIESPLRHADFDGGIDVSVWLSLPVVERKRRFHHCHHDANCMNAPYSK
jgi:hypothetical protein